MKKLISIISIFVICSCSPSPVSTSGNIPRWYEQEKNTFLMLHRKHNINIYVVFLYYNTSQKDIVYEASAKTLAEHKKKPTLVFTYHPSVGWNFAASEHIKKLNTSDVYISCSKSNYLSSNNYLTNKEAIEQLNCLVQNIDYQFTNDEVFVSDYNYDEDRHEDTVTMMILLIIIIVIVVSFIVNALYMDYEASKVELHKKFINAKKTKLHNYNFYLNKLKQIKNFNHVLLTYTIHNIEREINKIDRMNPYFIKSIEKNIEYLEKESDYYVDYVSIYNDYQVYENMIKAIKKAIESYKPYLNILKNELSYNELEKRSHTLSNSKTIINLKTEYKTTQDLIEIVDSKIAIIELNNYSMLLENIKSKVIYFMGWNIPESNFTIISIFSKLNEIIAKISIVNKTTNPSLSYIKELILEIDTILINAHGCIEYLEKCQNLFDYIADGNLDNDLKYAIAKVEELNENTTPLDSLAIQSKSSITTMTDSHYYLTSKQLRDVMKDTANYMKHYQIFQTEQKLIDTIYKNTLCNQ